MATNPFKAFVPFLIDADYDYIDDLSALRATDPSGGQWRAFGLVEPIKGEGLMVDLNGSGDLLTVQFNERILPGKVRDEALGKKVAQIEKQEGRKVSKKEYAQLRDQVEFDLLPKAFIRRTVVPVILSKQYLIICTSSAKRVDDCLGVLAAALDTEINAVQVQDDLKGQFRTLAIGYDQWDMDHDGMVAPFGPTDNAVLKGENKKTIRIKDKPLEDGDVKDILRLAEYEVCELGVAYGDKWDSEPEMTFTVNTSLVFKRVETVGIKTGGKEYDMHAHAAFVALQYRKMLTDFIEANGGLAETPVNGDDEEL